ncbi:phosphatase PAP2 family protein [Mucilaginibacter sp. HMF5004]|uniref:phosphatase PAP2 family protein n=1 Tax=Mucilaginibacter rivuli TaxID=2857527 RepID=UPI001C5F5F28|nr:phosphatase PAP2 family protein [Mucilaginibacter rivuli]MBW4891376.1 phosphatase PAP2 family protein [Mucilaginibacter rivuli]
MPQQLLQFDQHLFYLVNHGLSNAFFDWLMPIIRNPLVWIPLYVFIIAFSIYRYKKTGLYIILLLALTFGIADFGSASIIKPLMHRLRPCNDPALAQTIITRVPCGSGYSFPSSHASNHFAIAIFLCLVFGSRWRWVWPAALLWAFSISFAQVYVGVHYPVDVTGGALYGLLVGWAMVQLFRKIQPQFRL